jgi:DNA-binding response OmpR family regulator
MRVLIVDDDEAMRLLLAGMVSSEVKAEVQLAGTCEHALRLADTHAYDAILLDLLMPGIGGFAVLYRLRGSSANAKTPVIIVSSDGAAAQRCLAAGANAYLVKPVQPRELGATLRQHLAGRSHARN